jgi:BirA family biotin operon repressor/biotin-[acetyl-CoA-carboxylase] ligase
VSAVATSPRLDEAAIRAGLSTAVRASLASIALAQSTTSTQLDALAATTPARGAALFLAEHQTGGQGRQGRAWLSAPGQASLAMSLARRFALPMHAMSGLSLVAGVAIAEALALDAVKLKWPNDLVAGGRKLGGILVNLRAAPQGGCEAVIGIGLNLCLPDAASIDQPWTDLARLGEPVPSRNDLLAQLLESLLPALDRFERDGLASFLPRWRRLDALDGCAVQVLDGARAYAGHSAGITDTGALRVRLAHGEGERVFASGEVSLRRA